MTEAVSLAEVIGKLSVPTLLVLVVIAMIRGWLMLPRERDALKERLAKVEAECAKWEAMAIEGMRVAGTATTAAKHAIEGSPPKVQT